MADAKTFLADIEAVCRAHGLCISHEDTGGAFVIRPFDEANLRWLLDANFAPIQQRGEPELDAAAASLTGLIDDL